tara:strand:- start:598 stop:819 length:222 start_codon:yes stop_codon:yes gene_type:complete
MHPFFEDIDWDELMHNKAALQPAFVPQASIASSAYFDQDRNWSLGRLSFMTPDGTMQDDPNADVSSLFVNRVR